MIHLIWLLQFLFSPLPIRQDSMDGKISSWYKYLYRGLRLIIRLCIVLCLTILFVYIFNHYLGSNKITHHLSITSPDHKNNNIDVFNKALNEKISDTDNKGDKKYYLRLCELSDVETSKYNQLGVFENITNVKNFTVYISDDNNKKCKKLSGAEKVNLSTFIEYKVLGLFLFHRINFYAPLNAVTAKIAYKIHKSEGKSDISFKSKHIKKVGVKVEELLNQQNSHNNVNKYILLPTANDAVLRSLAQYNGLIQHVTILVFCLSISLIIIRFLGFWLPNVFFTFSYNSKNKRYSIYQIIENAHQQPNNEQNTDNQQTNTSDIRNATQTILKDLNTKENYPIFLGYIRHAFEALHREPHSISFLQATSDLAIQYKNFINIHNRICNLLITIIPSIGFIGTVVGISQALAETVNMQSTLLVKKEIAQSIISAQIGLAFDTTLVALFLSVIAMVMSSLLFRLEYMHITQTKTFVDNEILNKLK